MYFIFGKDENYGEFGAFALRRILEFIILLMPLHCLMRLGLLLPLPLAVV